MSLLPIGSVSSKCLNRSFFHPWLPLASTCVCVSFLSPPDPSDVYTVVVVFLRDPDATIVSESPAAADLEAANPTAREAISAVVEWWRRWCYAPLAVFRARCKQGKIQ